MKLAMPAIVGTIATSVVLATGAAGWNATATNGVQDERLKQLETRAEKTEELIRKLDETSTSVAVLNERIRQLMETQRAREQ